MIWVENWPMDFWISHDFPLTSRKKGPEKKLPRLRSKFQIGVVSHVGIKRPPHSYGGRKMTVEIMGWKIAPGASC